MFDRLLRAVMGFFDVKRVTPLSLKVCWLGLLHCSWPVEGSGRASSAS